MRIVRKISEIQKLCSSIKKKISFIPTMGALHKGHIELIKKGKEIGEVVVVSIFVNPLQFGEGEDYQRYPRDEEKDIEILKKCEVDIVFIPRTEEFYLPDFETYVEVLNLSKHLCGKYREGHFKGVCTVVCKLFNLIKPTYAIFGEKDAQQAIIIKKMVNDLNMGIKIITVPTVREKDGLAVSSRNKYLSPIARKEATVLYEALKYGKKLIAEGERESERVIKKMRKLIETKKLAKIEYIEIVDKKTLIPVKKIQNEVLLALCVWFENARLIDNLSIKI